MLRRLLFSLMVALSFGAQAQLFPFQPSSVDTTNLAVTGTAQNITLSSAQATPGNRQVVFTNSGTQTVFIRCDGTTVTTSNGVPIFPTGQYVLTVPGSVSTCSAIAAATGSTLYATSGTGQFVGSGGSQVQGFAASGSAVSGNPTLVAGSDGTNARTITTDTSGNQVVVGNVASGVADSANPVKVAGKYNATRPTIVDGQRADLQSDVSGNLGVILSIRQSAGVDTLGNSFLGWAGNAGQSASLGLVVTPSLYNENSWDRQRGNTSNIELASGSRTSTQTGSDHVNYNAKGIKVLVNVTIVGTGSITPSIQIKDANGIYYTVLTGTAIISNTTQTLTIYPGMVAAANLTINDILSRTFRIIITHNNANAITYSVGYELIL